MQQDFLHFRPPQDASQWESQWLLSAMNGLFDRAQFLWNEPDFQRFRQSHCENRIQQRSAFELASTMGHLSMSLWILDRLHDTPLTSFLDHQWDQQFQHPNPFHVHDLEVDLAPSLSSHFRFWTQTRGPGVDWLSETSMFNQWLADCPPTQKPHDFFHDRFLSLSQEWKRLHIQRRWNRYLLSGLQSLTEFKDWSVFDAVVQSARREQYPLDDAFLTDLIWSRMVHLILEEPLQPLGSWRKAHLYFERLPWTGDRELILNDHFRLLKQNTQTFGARQALEQYERTMEQWRVRGQHDCLTQCISSSQTSSEETSKIKRL